MTETPTLIRARLGNLVAALLGTLFCIWAVGGGVERVAPRAHDYEVVVVRDPARIPAGAKGRQVWVREATIAGCPATRAGAHPALLPGTITATHLLDRLSHLNGRVWQYVCWLFAASLGAALPLGSHG